MLLVQNFGRSPSSFFPPSCSYFVSSLSGRSTGIHIMAWVQLRVFPIANLCAGIAVHLYTTITGSWLASKDPQGVSVEWIILDFTLSRRIIQSSGLRTGCRISRAIWLKVESR